MCVTPDSANLLVVLGYLLSLKKSGISINLLKVYLASVTTLHQQVEGYSIFSHPTMKRLLKGNLFPQPRASTTQWEHNLVLKGLTRLLFEPMATCSLIRFSMKMAFLIAITSARRIGDMVALMAHPMFTVFFPGKVTLRPHPKFIPKVTSTFHMNQLIQFPTFYPKPHKNN